MIAHVPLMCGRVTMGAKMKIALYWLLLSICHWKPWCSRPILCAAISLHGETERSIFYSSLVERDCDLTCGVKKLQEMITLAVRIVEGTEGLRKTETETEGLWTGRPPVKKNSALTLISVPVPQTRRIMFVANNQCARALLLLHAF